MLCKEYYEVHFSEFDRQMFRAFVPAGHYLREALRVIAWDDFYDILSPYYREKAGRPAESPVRMLKLEYLRYQENLSDRQVIARAQTDLAYRYFLQLGAASPLPDPSSLCYFRGRLGVEGFRAVFRRVIAMARERGLVKDRLRLKDASHVIANIAVPTTLALVAQMRDKLFAAAEAFDPQRVAGERVNVDLVREATAGQNAEQRLEARVTQLREALLWIDELPPPPGADTDPAWQRLLERRRLAHKILADQEHPGSGDRTLSTVDATARRGKHGVWYDGYLLDVLLDPDSRFVTEIDVLCAGGDEAASAVALIRQEEGSHGNDVEALSIDKAGFNGPMLRELEDPEGLAVNTFVPPKREAATTIFTPADFVPDGETGDLRCPAGQTSSYRQRDGREHGWIHRFKLSQCASCPLLARCMSHAPEGVFGKTVRKNDYEAEYQRARQKAKTDAYASVRAEHPMVERKLGEILNRHGGRRTRYWGRAKTLIHELMATMAANVKEFVRWLRAPTAALSPID